jgi:hypothetical protein
LMRKGTAEAEKTEILTTVLGIFGYELWKHWWLNELSKITLTVIY